MKLFNPEFRHIKGKENVVSDALSRKKLDDPTSSDEEDIIDGELGFNLSVQVENYTGEWLDLVLYLSTLQKPRSEMTDKEFDKLCKHSFAYMVRDGTLFRKSKRGRMPRRVIIKENEKMMILKSLHDEFGHRGVNGTYMLVGDRYYWPGLYVDVKQFCESCHECQVRSQKRVQEPLRPKRWIVFGSLMLSQ